MRTPNSRPLRAAGATIVSLGLILGLGACSSDASTEQFCTDTKAFETALDSPTPDEEDMDEALEQLAKVEAPNEIKDDWDYVSQASKEMIEVLRDFDLTEAEDIEAAEERFEEIEEKFDEERLTEASDNVDEFRQKNCEL